MQIDHYGVSVSGGIRATNNIATNGAIEAVDAKLSRACIGDASFREDADTLRTTYYGDVDAETVESKHLSCGRLECDGAHLADTTTTNLTIGRNPALSWKFQETTTRNLSVTARHGGKLEFGRHCEEPAFIIDVRKRAPVVQCNCDMELTSSLAVGSRIHCSGLVQCKTLQLGSALKLSAHSTAVVVGSSMAVHNSGLVLGSFNGNDLLMSEHAAPLTLVSRTNRPCIQMQDWDTSSAFANVKHMSQSVDLNVFEDAFKINVGKHTAMRLSGTQAEFKNISTTDVRCQCVHVGGTAMMCGTDTGAMILSVGQDLRVNADKLVVDGMAEFPQPVLMHTIDVRSALMMRGQNPYIAAPTMLTLQSPHISMNTQGMRLYDTSNDDAALWRGGAPFERVSASVDALLHVHTTSSTTPVNISSDSPSTRVDFSNHHPEGAIAIRMSTIKGVWATDVDAASYMVHAPNALVPTLSLTSECAAVQMLKCNSMHITSPDTGVQVNHSVSADGTIRSHATHTNTADEKEIHSIVAPFSDTPHMDIFFDGKGPSPNPNTLRVMSPRMASIGLQDASNSCSLNLTPEGDMEYAADSHTHRFNDHISVGSLFIASTLVVNGLMTITESVTRINTTDIEIQDTVMHLGKGNVADEVHLGVLMQHGADSYSGLLRNPGGGFSFIEDSDLTSATIDTSMATKADLEAGDLLAKDATFNSVNSENGILIGNQHQDGSYKIHVEDGSLVISKQIGGAWITKQTLD